MDKVKVRAMNLGDIDKILKIEKQSFASPWSRESFYRELRENRLARYLVIEINGGVVGYGGMWIIVDEAHITNIAISPDYRRRDLGSFLLEAMIDYAQKINVFKMTLEVRKSNIPAQRLYEKFGFISAGIRPRYYQDNNEDAVIMWRMEDS